MPWWEAAGRAPRLGEHSREILAEVLGEEGGRIAALAATGAIVY